MISSINKTFGCCSEIFGCSNKKLFVVPNFVAVTKPFFFRDREDLTEREIFRIFIHYHYQHKKNEIHCIVMRHDLRS